MAIFNEMVMTHGLRLRTLPVWLLGWVLLSTFGATETRADFFEHRWLNQQTPMSTWRLSPEVRYYSSTENFSNGIGPTAVAGLTSYSRIEVDATAAFGITDRFTLFGRITWADVKIGQTTAAISGISYGLTDQSIGANFRLLGTEDTSRPTIDAQFQVDIPGYQNTKQTLHGLPLLGDQSTDFTIGAFGRMPLFDGAAGALALKGGAGFTYRSNQFSAAIPYRFMGDFQPSEKFRAELGVEGLQSMRTNTVAPATTDQVSSGAGGSLRIGAVAPSYIDVAGGIGYRVGENSWVNLHLARTIWGDNAPASTLVTAGFTFNLERDGTTRRVTTPSAKRRSKAPSEQTPEQYGKSNRGFVKYGTEGKVTKVVEEFQMFRIDLGQQQGVERGQVYDVFELSADNKLGAVLARAKVTDARNDDATLVITEWFVEKMLQEGFAVKRLLD